MGLSGGRLGERGRDEPEEEGAAERHRHSRGPRVKTHKSCNFERGRASISHKSAWVRNRPADKTGPFIRIFRLFLLVRDICPKTSTPYPPIVRTTPVADSPLISPVIT